MEVLNATTMVLNDLASWSSIGWVTTLITFIFIVFTLFLIFRNFRRVIYGAVPSGVALIIYKISRWLGISTQEKNYVPITWFFYIVGFILISWVFGYFIEKYFSKAIKRWLNKIYN